MSTFGAHLLFLLLAICGIASSIVRLSKPIKQEDPKENKAYNPENKFGIDKYRNRKISAEAQELSGQKLVDFVNSHQPLWKADFNKFEEYSNRYKMLGLIETKPTAGERKKYVANHSKKNISIPENFDSRAAWNNCTSIKTIRDQSSCGSCWAFAAVEAMSDRICIASEGELQPTLSSRDLLSCCKNCGYGCRGGYKLQAWRYWVKKGIVTGGNYTNRLGCQPYPFPPCDHADKAHYGQCEDLYSTPLCLQKCQKRYANSYENDKYYGKNSYFVGDSEAEIQEEIMRFGPVETGFTVYTDFYSYSSGIYHHTAGSSRGGHAVKMIGWGVENGVPYWLLANSWNSDWGEDGFFRILRGVDECGIESSIVAGLPDVE